MPHKNILQIFSLSTFFTVVLRFFQLYFTIDTKTGFSVTGRYEKINIILYVLMLVLIALPTFFSAVSSNRQPTRAPIPKSFPLLTISNFVVAICFLAKAGILFLSLEALVFYDVLGILLYLVSAVWFIIYGTAGLVKIKLPVVFSIAPIFLYLYQLVSLFISHNGLTNISENIISTIYLCVLLYYLLLQSKILCRITIRKTSRVIFPIGLLTFMLMAVGNLPALAIRLIGSGDVLHSSSVFNIEYFVLGLYALIFTLQLYSKSKWPTSPYQRSTERMEVPRGNNPFIMEQKEEN